LPDIGPKQLRVVERLANKLYDASGPRATPWLRQGWTVRQAWLKEAGQRLRDGESFGDRLGALRDVWGKIRLPRL
jgi:hypothetical protein